MCSPVPMNVMGLLVAATLGEMCTNNVKVSQRTRQENQFDRVLLRLILVLCTPEREGKLFHEETMMPERGRDSK